jgi:hypothetical protein
MGSVMVLPKVIPLSGVISKLASTNFRYYRVILVTSNKFDSMKRSVPLSVIPLSGAPFIIKDWDQSEGIFAEVIKISYLRLNCIIEKIENKCS